MDRNSRKLLDVLGVGKDGALQASQLKLKTGFNPREIRMIVNKLRINGYPICSGIDGYWIASEAVDIENTIKILASTRNNYDRVIKGLYASADRLKNAKSNCSSI